MLSTFEHRLLHVVGSVVAQSLKSVKLLNQRLPTFLLCDRIAEAWRNNVGSVCTALPTLLGPRMHISHGLQKLSVVFFPRCTACPNLHLFAHLCQHRRNNSPPCLPINVGSCFLTVLTAVYLNFLVFIVGTCFVPILSTYAPALMLSGHSLS